MPTNQTNTWITILTITTNLTLKFTCNLHFKVKFEISKYIFNYENKTFNILLSVHLVKVSFMCRLIATDKSLILWSATSGARLTFLIHGIRWFTHMNYDISTSHANKTIRASIRKSRYKYPLERLIFN